MILHLSQIFLTDALTFIVNLTCVRIYFEGLFEAVDDSPASQIVR